MRRILRVTVVVFIILLSLAILAAGGLVVYLGSTSYRPLPVETAVVEREAALPALDRDELTLLTWNIGYAGLGKEMDFFNEGGTMVRPDREQFREYLEGIKRTILTHNTADFILLQEVDAGSKRSYHTDEIREITERLTGFGYAFARNYDCRFVPVPLTEPMGDVISGIVTLTQFRPVRSEKIDYQTRFSWPKGLVMLKRCFLAMTFDLENCRRLVLVNTHNSVFDRGGKLRIKELRMLHSFATEEYLKGNFVIIGGDWNMNPGGYDRKAIMSGDLARDYDMSLIPGFLPGWTIAYDPGRPTNRDVNQPYVRGRTLTTIIDFFAVSPNIRVIEVHTDSTGFAHSDHQPVSIRIRLLTDQK